MSLTAKDRLIFALDVPDRSTALDLVARLQHEVGLFKMGLELFLAEGRGLLQELANLVPGRIFLDLKLYDIPATVVGALNSVLHGVALTTVPCDLGFRGLQQIVSSIGTAYKILAVTVLTSIDASDLKPLGFSPRFAMDPEALVVRKAKLAREAGCAGVVCSGQEARAVREACGPDFLIVCPGIRPAWSLVAGDDQSRIVTPRQAIRDGADYLVVGRPIRTAVDQAQAAREVVQEIIAGLAERDF